MTTFAVFALTTLLAHALPDDAAPKIDPTRIRWCATLLELARQDGTDRAKVIEALRDARELMRERIATIDHGHDRLTRESRSEQAEAHHGAVKLNFRHAHHASARETGLRRAHGRLLQLERDLVSATEGHVARVDRGRENVLALLERLEAGAQSLQDSSGEFEDGDPGFNRRAYARYLRNMGLVGALAIGFGSGTYVAIGDHASNGVLALLGSSTYFSLRGLWDIRKHYQRRRSSKEGRIRTENDDVDRIDVEREAVARMRAVATHPESFPDKLVSHGYSLHVPAETFVALMAGEDEIRALSRSPYRFRRGEHTLFVDLTLFEARDGELSLISALRPKLTRDVPRSLANSRVVGDL